jgi:aryl-alcohol dehydrogenase-like predicted oxidoreductase
MTDSGLVRDASPQWLRQGVDASLTAQRANHVQDSVAAADLSLSKAGLSAIDKIMASATPVAGPSPEGMQ